MISLGRLGISRRLLAVNALLAALSVGFSIYIIGQMTSSPGAPVPARAVTAAAAVDPSAGAPVQPSPGIYSMIGIRNLFSPTRLDTATAGTAVAPAGVRLNLFGVVLAGDRSIAYLEDPVSKRVYGYRLGDSVAGGVIRAIEADRIVLERVKQTLDVRLHDPSRARRNLAAASAGVDGSSAAATPDRPADAQAPAMPPVPPTYRPPLARPPLGRPGAVTPARIPTPASATVPPITLESLPKISGPGTVPANATSDDLSLR